MLEDPDWIYLICRLRLRCDGRGAGEVICYECLCTIYVGSELAVFILCSK